MFDCCKWIFKFIINDWPIVLFDLDICVKLYLYISSHLFLCQKAALQMSISKWKRAKKALFQKLVWLGKGGVKCIQNVWCQSQKLIPQRNIKTFMASLLKNWVVLIKWYEKWKPNENFSINVNTLVGVIYVHFY